MSQSLKDTYACILPLTDKRLATIGFELSQELEVQVGFSITSLTKCLADQMVQDETMKDVTCQEKAEECIEEIFREIPETEKIWTAYRRVPNKILNLLSKRMKRQIVLLPYFKEEDFCVSHIREDQIIFPDDMDDDTDPSSSTTPINLPPDAAVKYYFIFSGFVEHHVLDLDWANNGSFDFLGSVFEKTSTKSGSRTKSHSVSPFPPSALPAMENQS